MRSKRRKESACPERGFEPSAPSGRCSEGRIGRNREYCKRQRSKTTIFQPALWMRVQRADGGVASGLLLFTATPQSIRLAAYCQLPGRGAFWVVLPPACPERGGGCEQSEQTEGLQRGCSCLRQPLSQFALRRIASSPAGESLGGIHKLLYNLGGPPMTAPTPHLINLWQKQGDAQRPPYLHNLLR